MKTVKALMNKKHITSMKKDAKGNYLITTGKKDNEPVVVITTKDYIYATTLFDNIIDNLQTNI